MAKQKCASKFTIPVQHMGQTQNRSLRRPNNGSFPGYHEFLQIGVDQHPRRTQILDIIRKTLVPRDLRVMVTCRQTVSVEEVLKNVGTAKSYLQMSEDHVRLDLKVLIPKRLQSFPFIKASEELQEDIERKLIEYSRGM